jgi:hypothetical protein
MTENDMQAEVFMALGALSEVVPQMRAGQLMAAVGELCADLHGRGLWDASDAELLEAVWRFRRDFTSGYCPLAPLQLTAAALSASGSS